MTPIERITHNWLAREDMAAALVLDRLVERGAGEDEIAAALREMGGRMDGQRMDAEGELAMLIKRHGCKDPDEAQL